MQNKPGTIEFIDSCVVRANYYCTSCVVEIGMISIVLFLYFNPVIEGVFL